MQTFYVGLLFKLNFNKARGRVFMCGRRSKRLSPTCLVFDTVDAREVFLEFQYIPPGIGQGVDGLAGEFLHVVPVEVS